MVPKIYRELSALGICDGKEPTNDALQPFRSWSISSHRVWSWLSVSGSTARNFGKFRASVQQLTSLVSGTLIWWIPGFGLIADVISDIRHFFDLHLREREFCHYGFCVRRHIASWDSNQSAKHRKNRWWTEKSSDIFTNRNLQISISFLTHPTVLNTPHGTQDIPQMHHDIPTVLNTPHSTHDISTVLMITPTVPMISPHMLHDIPHMYHGIPHGTEHPHGNHDIPHGTEHPQRYSWRPQNASWCPPTVLMNPPTVLNTPTVLMISPTWIMISPHGTQDIPHGTQDNPHGIEHPPRYSRYPPRYSWDPPWYCTPPRYCTHTHTHTRTHYTGWW